MYGGVDEEDMAGVSEKLGILVNFGFLRRNENYSCLK